MKPYPAYKPSGVAWLGEVPAHWNQMRLRDAVEGCLNGIWGDEPDGGDNDTPVVRVADFDRQGRIAAEHPTIRSIPKDQRAARELVAGDLLIEKSGGGDLQPVGMTVQYQSVARAVSSNFVGRMRPRDDAHSRFLVYLHAHLYTTGVSMLSVKQSTGIQNLDSTAYLSERCYLPPFSEQQAIAAYLDRETARIDTLIAEKGCLIDTLREYRQAVITDHTTGLGRTDAKTSTGNIFCPSVPSDWTMVRLGKYSRIGNGSTPLKDNAEYWGAGTFPWLNSAVVNQDEVHEGSEFVTDEALRACHLPIVEPGAVLVALTGQGKTRGQATVLRIQATINQHLAFISLDTKKFDSDYVFWTLTGMYGALRMVSDGQGGTKGALTCEDLSRFEVPMPSLAEQRKIAQTIAHETASIDKLLAHVQDEIKLLQELRAATITDAVTGKIQVS